VSIQDLAVESADVIYVAEVDSAEVVKSTNGGFIWDDPEDTGNDGDNFMLDSLGKDKLILGSDNGWVSYSTDGNSTWENIDKQLDDEWVQVTASGLNSGDFIYASTWDATGEGANVYHWQIGTNTSWDDIIDGTLAVDTDDDDEADLFFSAIGIELYKGTLNILGVDDDNNRSALWRTLSPSTATSTTGWSYKLSAEDVYLYSEPQGLDISSGSVKLWAVNLNFSEDFAEDNTDQVFSFTDTLVDASVGLTAPADALKVTLNVIQGRAHSVAFQWPRVSNATKYHLQIALDKDFVQVGKTFNVTNSDDNVVVILGPFSEYEDANFEWEDGATYYWRVRVDQPLRSPWSAGRSFTVAVATVTPPVTITPAPPAPTINLPAPTINLPPPQTITIPPAPTITIPPPPAPPAPIAPAYIWAIVIIGAVLVIAVIILIVRTRRPV
jgi:hypothetical protein